MRTTGFIHAKLLACTFLFFTVKLNATNQIFLKPLYKTTTEEYKKYCYTTYAGKYEITLYDNGTKKVLYKLYNNAGNLQKTMQGTWVIRDEGVYGPAYMLTLSWTGPNENMPALKFVCQYNGNRELQGIIDGQNRIWDRCY